MTKFERIRDAVAALDGMEPKPSALEILDVIREYDYDPILSLVNRDTQISIECSDGSQGVIIDICDKGMN